MTIKPFNQRAINLAMAGMVLAVLSALVLFLYQGGLTEAQDPPANNEATGKPTISGTAQVDKTLAADTTGIADTDGLSGATFSYQWVTNDGAADTDITDATDSTYTLVAADEGMTIKVRVRFTDDAGNEETLTSAATMAVTPGPTVLPAQTGPSLNLTSLSLNDQNDATVSIGSFDPATTAYTATVDSTTERVTISASASAGSKARIYIFPEDTQTDSGHQVELNHGANVILISVHSFNIDQHLNTYSVTITKGGSAPADAATDVDISGRLWAREGSTIPFLLTRTGDTSQPLTVPVDVTEEGALPPQHVLDPYYPSTRPVTATEEDRDLLPPSSKGRISVEFQAGYASARLDIPTNSDSVYQGTSRVEAVLVDGDAYDVGSSGLTESWVWDDDRMKTYLRIIHLFEQDGTHVDIGTFSRNTRTYSGNVGSETEWTTVVTYLPFGAKQSGVRILPADSRPNIPGHQIDLAHGVNSITVGLDLWDRDYDIGTYEFEVTRAGSVSADNTPTVSIHGLRSGIEGYTMPFLITRTGDADQALTVPIDVVETGGDTLPPMSEGRFNFEFQAGYASATYYLETVDDNNWEEHATVAVALVDGDGYEISSESRSASSWIKDNDVPDITAALTVDSNQIGEGEVVTATVTVTADVPQQPHAYVGNLDFTPEPGTAQREDYEPNLDGIVGANTYVYSAPYDGGDIVFPVNEQALKPVENCDGAIEYLYQVSIPIRILEDDISETDETFNIFLEWKDGFRHVGRTLTLDQGADSHTITILGTAPGTTSNSRPTGAPAISGTAHVGQTLTADTSGIADADGLANAIFSYQWIVGECDIDGATGSSYTLTPDEEGKTIKVRVSFTDDAGNEETLTSAVTDAVAAQVNNPATGNPTISGTAQVGETLTADTSGIADADGLDNATFAYQWMHNDGTSDEAIEGATQAMYDVQVGDANKMIKVQVSFTDDAGHQESVTSSATARVPAIWAGVVTVGNDALGSEAVGYSVFSIGMGSVTDPTFEVDGVEYEVDAVAYDDRGLHLALSNELWSPFTVHVDTKMFESSAASTSEGSESYIYTWSQPGLNWSQGNNVLVVILEANVAGVAATGSPTISGTAQVGETLTADTSGIADADGLDNATFSYQWVHSDGSADAGIQDAVNSTYTLVESDEGKTIKVRVSFTDDAGNEETLTSAATATVESPLTAELQNVPTSHNGQNVFTFRILFSEDVTVGYQALKEDSFEISNATITKARRVSGRNDLRQFTVHPSSDAAVVLGLEAGRPCDDDGAICTSGDKRLSNSLELTVPGPAPANEPATGAPTVSGSAQVGQTLTASTSGISDADGLVNAAFNHQWLRNDGATGTAIQGATGATYTLVSLDEGKTIAVRVSFTDDAGHEETLTSVATEAVEGKANTPASGLPTISGTPQVGETLTADTSAIADEDGLDDISYSYQWLADDTDISGATGSTHTLVAADEGKTIKVRVSFTDEAGNDESVTSDATAAVSAAELSLSDLDVGDGQDVLASALIRVGDRGRKNDENTERAWYALDTSAWHASGELRDGSLTWNDMTLNRVVYLPDTDRLRFNDSDAAHIGESFADGGVNRELTIWIQTEEGQASFRAKDQILNSGSNYINFTVPEAVRSTLDSIATNDLIIVAVSAPDGA